MNKRQSKVLFSLQMSESWDRASQIVSRNLKVSANSSHAIHSAWAGLCDNSNFKRIVGLSDLSAKALLKAASTWTAPDEQPPTTFDDILRGLGLPLCASVLAIAAACRALIAKRPPPLWAKLSRKMMTEIEIGYYLGMRVLSLGPAAGMVVGAAHYLGFMIMLAENEKAARELLVDERTQGDSPRQIASFGCEAFQLSAFALQKLGFGVEISFGAALAAGGVDVSQLGLDDEVKRWLAAYAWIQALKEARGYPAQIEYRELFHEIMPMAEGKNPTLGMLYTNVSGAKNNGSSWTWHLPQGSYEELEEQLRTRDSG